MRVLQVFGAICLISGAILFLTAPIVALSDTDSEFEEEINSEYEEPINSEYQAFPALPSSNDENESESLLIFCPPIIYTDPGIELGNGFLGFGLMLLGVVLVGVGEKRMRLTLPDVTGLESD